MRKIVLILLVTVLACLSIKAQKCSFYSTDNALSNSLINSIYQDHRNYIWIATEDGLNKFDGVRFTIYHNRKDDKYSLKNNYVRTVFEDSKGRIWIGCISGLQLYDKAEDKFVEIPVYLKGKRVSPHITSIIETPDGELWVSSSGKGILRSGDGGKSFYIDEDLYKSVCSHYLVALHLDKKGQLWIASENQGLNMYHPESGRLVSYKTPSSIGSNQISCIEEDNDGNIYAGTLTGGLYRFNQLLNKFESVLYSEPSVVLPVKCLSFDKNGLLLVGTDGMGIKYLNNKTEKLEDYQLLTSFFDLSKTKVHSIYNDKSGNLWIGLFQKGVFFSPNHANEFRYWGPKSFYKNIIGSNCIMSLFQDKQDNIWVGTDNDGMYAIKGNKSEHYNVSSPGNRVLGSIMSMIEDDNENIWLGSYIDGLIKFKKKSGETYFYKNSNVGPYNNTFVNRARSLAFDSNKRIWVGTYGAGIQIFDTRSSEYVDKFIYTETDSTGICNNWINCIKNDGDSLIWIGTYKGASCINLKTRKIKSFYGFNGTLIGNIVLSVYRDSRGLMWFGTTEGLTCINTSTYKSEHLTVKDGLICNSVCGILEDEKGNLWLSTHNGISNFIVTEKRFINYNSYDGLQCNEFSMGAAYKSSHGEMFFGGVSGVASFFPSKIYETKTTLNFYLTGLYVFDKLVVKGQKSGSHEIVNDFISDVKKIKLDYKDKMFSLEFSTFDYGSQGRVFYKYKMSGLNNSWITTEKGINRVAFSNLDYGHYKIHVKACINDLESDEKIWEIVIYPPWYLRKLAKLIYLLLFFGLVWIIYRIINERIKNRQELIRREHIEEINEGKLNFFTNISHEIRTPMSLIISPLEKLLAEDKDAGRQEVYKLIHRNSQRILRLINQLLDVRKIDKGQMVIRMRETDIVSFIKDVMHTFEYQAKIRDVKFGFIHEMDELNVWIDINNFDKVMVNIISNAFKFTPEKGEINIILNTGSDMKSPESALQEYFEIIVSDNGIGIQDEQIERIFERFYQIDNAQTGSNFGTGIGLHLAKNLVELMHGKIFARNKHFEKGCEFVIRLPMGSVHLPESEKENIKTDTDYKTDRTTSGKDEIELTMSEQELAIVKSRAKTRYRILIVDDEDEIRNYLHKELSEIYKVKECCNGKEALDYILKDKPDLVISDIMMPEMDGMTLCKKIKSNLNISHIPVLLLTAKTGYDDKAEGFDTGADGYVCKPFNMELLKKQIAGIIANRERIEHKSINEKETNPLIEQVVVKSNDQIVFEKIMKVINENISDQNLNVEMLAEKIGMSRVHMYRKLKEITNMSARDLIKSIRLKQAADLLYNQKLTVSEVAYALGFSNLSHFSVSFKEFYGVSPKEYANKNAKKG